jgi:PAS domain S-box-containing protein
MSRTSIEVMIRTKLPHVVSFTPRDLSSAGAALMTGAYVYTPATWPPLAAAVLLAAIGLYAWRRRDVPGAVPFVAMSALSILILVGIACEAAAVAPATKLYWYKFQFVILIAAATPVTCFVLDYAYPGRWLTRRNVILLSIPPILCLLMALINDSQPIWRRLDVQADGTVVLSYGPAGVLLVAYAVGLYLLYAAVFLWLFLRSPQHRWPVALMLLGQISSRAAFLFDNGHPAAPSYLDLSVLVVVLPWTTYAIAMFGFHILDPLQAARRTAVEQMKTGVIVFDADWRVVSLNPAAQGILGAGNGAAHGKAWRQLLPSRAPPPDLSDASPREAGAGNNLSEVTWSFDKRQYAPSLCALRDFRGLLMGYLLMLRDVTEERRAQAQMLAQQWAQAVLQEREQLAHELHDGLSQDLAFLNLQAQAADLFLRAGQGDASQASLARLAEVSRKMQGDLRELIGNLLVVSLPSLGFCATLQQIAAHYEQQWGLAVRLQIEPSAEVLCTSGLLPPAAGVQLIRIVQEALANVRKHAGAPDQVSVQLRVDTGSLHLAIADNGAGFDPQACGVAGRHYGLQVMRGRAERIGGQLSVHAAPGQGTRVEVSIPLCVSGEEAAWETRGGREWETG